MARKAGYPNFPKHDPRRAPPIPSAGRSRLDLSDGMDGHSMMYTSIMRRIQIYIDEAVDEALQAEAARTGTSKAALIRECVAARFNARIPLEDDAMTELVGSVDAEPADIDEVVYG